MVNYRDRPGALRYGAAIPFPKRNPKYKKIGTAYGFIYIVSGFFCHQISLMLKEIIYTHPYWQDRRDKMNIRKLNFDLIIDSNATPKETINEKSIF
ncbi:unnamed protein product [Blepharisma stoltei]|uniref:Uncharacterized protein n=1 Tax=Blepharisma stoltei TaxID=1481888 RepID=A0AAU9IFR4_9CILI|nr:unnamed protein product [Blepharisma stoltei]